MWQFARENPGTFFFVFWIAAWAVTRPFYFAYIAWNRTLRSRNIAAAGWPKAPMDADGDIIHPSDDEK